MKRCPCPLTTGCVWPVGSTCGNWEGGVRVRKGHFFSQVPPYRQLKLSTSFAGVPLPTTLSICSCDTQSLPPSSQFPHPPLPFSLSFFFLFFFFFWPHCTVCDIRSQTRDWPMPTAVEAQSPNNRTARGRPSSPFVTSEYCLFLLSSLRIAHTSGMSSFLTFSSNYQVRMCHWLPAKTWSITQNFPKFLLPTESLIL